MTAQNGQKYRHPEHGVMTITRVGPGAPDEYIDGGWRTGGSTIHAEFSRFIPAVKWRVGNGAACRSMLVFHSYYLSKLEQVQQ